MVTNTQMVMDELGYDSVSVEDCRNIHYICHLVGKRAAYLASAGKGHGCYLLVYRYISLGDA